MLMLALATPAVTSQGSAQVRSNAVYIALGDSIAAGVGSSLPERRGYPVVVRDLMELHLGGTVELTNHAVPGETARSFLDDGQFDAFSRTVERFEDAGLTVDLVSVSLGGNELLASESAGTVERQQALMTFRESFDEAIARIRGEVGDNALIVVTTYYDLSEGDPLLPSSDSWWVEQFNQAIRDTAERHDAVVADVWRAFRDSVALYTHHPYDAHPKNQGFRAIARQVWRAIGWDTEAPEVRVTSEEKANRRTPTLQFTVADNVDVASVTVTFDDRPPVEPVQVGAGSYALLLDFRGDDSREHVVSVEAVDSAGNETQIEHRIVIQVGE